MRLRNVRLVHFRNHTETAFSCSPTANIFVGKNGEGKTNILEGISYLCLTKSFYAASDATALQLGAEAFAAQGSFEAEGGLTFETAVSYTGAERRKTMTVNGQAPESLATMVGQFPVVILSPENSNITFGGPGDRRRFIDLVVSQSNRGYLEDLLEYRRILRQRNRILADGRDRPGSVEELLEPWTQSLIDCGSRIVARRMRFVQEFEPGMREAFARIAAVKEMPTLRYQGTVDADGDVSADGVRGAFAEAVKRMSAQEQRAGLTLVGPHRDELGMTINDLELRGYASQGQHKTYLVALKLAEVAFLRERCREAPIILLDDVLSELDEERATRLLKEAASMGQTFITATDATMFDRTYGARGYRRFTVSGGQLADHE